MSIHIQPTEAEDAVCITGSLYVVAEAREIILGESVLRP